MHIQSQGPDGVLHGWDDPSQIPSDHRRLTDLEIQARLNELSLQFPPLSVTRRQARLALLAAGKLSAVEAAIASIADPIQQMAAQIEYENATWERSNPWVDQLGAAVGLTPADIDQLFITAASL